MMTTLMPDNQQQVQQPILSSTYPSAPMEYVNLFTNENVKLGKVPPPPPIIKDSYMSFGKLIDPNDVLIRSLESQGIECFYSLNNYDVNKSTSMTNTMKKINTNNHKRELKKLNHSILIAYLDLLEILVKAPNTIIAEDKAASGLTQELNEQQQQQQAFLNNRTLREQKLNDIELLFINMHHLINELRPHQARDNIRCILEMQKEQRIETANKFKNHIIKIVDLLNACISSLQQQNIDSTNNSEKIKFYFEELNDLLKNAKKLTNSLDKLNNGNLLKINELTEIEDIEMKSIEDLNNANDINDTTINNFNSKILLKSTTEPININKKINNNTEIYLHNKNCEFKDLILCGLIDDYLTNKTENEF